MKVKWTIVLLVAGIVLLGAVSAWASDLYVNPTGAGSAYTTIQAAINAAHSGDVIHVAAGIYQEVLNIDKTLTLQGAPGAKIQPATNADEAVLITANNVAMKGFEIDGTQATIRYGLYGFNTDGLLIEDNVMHDITATDSSSGVGILLFGWSDTVNNNTIKDNTIYNTDRMGIFAGGMQDSDPWGWLISSGNVFDGNDVYNTWQSPNGDAGGAIQLNGAENSTITDNNVHDTANGNWGIYMFGFAAGNTITDNTIRDNPIGVQLWISSEGGTPIVWGVAIKGRIIKDYSKGGIKVYSGNVAISNNIIEANVIPNPSYSEDSIYIKGDANVTVSSNTLRNNHYTGTIYNPSTNDWSTAAGLSVHDTAVITAMYNSIYNNDFGIHVKHNTANVVAHYNDIHGNTVYGFFFEGVGGNPSSPFDATLNWWGDANGPTHASNPAGAGDRVSDHVIFSPWLGIDPDGNPALAGVQITGPMLIIVAPVGPVPAGGYLNTAIAGANSPDLPYTDTIEVKHGTYDASTPITQPVNIVSEPGSAAHTTLNGNMSINSNGVLIGLPLQGFRMNGDVTVGAGNDAGTSSIHWSDLYGNVTNNGTGTFNAQYNYWGTQLASVIDARTTGLVDYTPFLPKNADDSYTDIQALLAAGVAGGIDPAIDQLWLMTRLGQDVSTFIGYAGVAGAGAFAGAPAGGEINFGGAAGGGGAVEGTMSGTYEIGTPITGQFTITDPVTGDPITDAAVTTSLLGPDGALVFWGCATYDETTGEYVFSIDTTGLAPGTYELIIQTDDGQSKTVSIEVQAA